MVDLTAQTTHIISTMRRKVASKQITAADAKACLEHAKALAIRVEAAKTVTGGFFSDSILNTVDTFLSLAVPFASFGGDYELTTLLSSLKVWVQKKRNEAEMEKMQANMSSSNNNWGSDLNFSYTF